MRAVVLVVVRVGVPVHEVVAGQERRASPVGGLAEDLPRARVGVVLVGDAAVEHCHGHRRLALLDAPGALGVHLVEVPLVAVVAVVGLQGRRLRAAHEAVGLGVGHLGHPGQPFDGLGHARARVEGDEEPGCRPGATRFTPPGLAERALDLAGLRGRAEGDDHLALAPGPGGRGATGDAHRPDDVLAVRRGRRRRARPGARERRRPRRESSSSESRRRSGGSQRNAAAPAAAATRRRRRPGGTRGRGPAEACTPGSGRRRGGR